MADRASDPRNDRQENREAKFRQVLVAATHLPGVRVDRAAYLGTALRKHCTPAQISAAIETTPAEAGVSRDVIIAVANTSVRYETGKVTALSAVAGLPGGLAMVGTVPVDTAQYFGHVLRISQKLAYIYSWPDLFSDDEDLDEATEGLLILFVGVMFGVNGAQATVSKLAGMIAEQTIKTLPRRALTKGVIYPVVKKVATVLGAKMTKQIFANGVAKIVPFIGAGFAGGLSLATFYPMSRRLQSHLAGLEIAAPSENVTIPGEVVKD